MADLVMNYYTDYEPEHTWVTESEGGVIGYISACFDEAGYNRIMLFKIIPVSLIRAERSEQTASTKNFVLKNF